MILSCKQTALPSCFQCWVSRTPVQWRYKWRITLIFIRRVSKNTESLETNTCLMGLESVKRLNIRIKMYIFTQTRVRNFTQKI